MLTSILIYVKFYVKENIIFVIIFLWIQIGQAIDASNIVHDPQDIFYVNLPELEIRLKTKKGDVTEVSIISGNKRMRMEIAYTDENFDYFAANWDQPDTVLTYYFILKDKSDSLKFPFSGEFKAHMPLLSVPDWALGKVYYSIFPDGFYDGNQENNPPNVIPWNEKPELWRSYGGDLIGIIKNIAYLDTIDPDIVILQPIFPAQSNHKLNPNNYAIIDPVFGDTTDLKVLISELHKRNKKIILNFVCTHTGIDFPAFADILENGKQSRYFEWYLIKATPVKVSATNYACWRSDKRFPKLNLQNPEVQNYLISYIEYWKHFGFDGFYIGEDQQIDTSYVKRLYSYLKSKYPDLLILGCADQLQKDIYFNGYTKCDIRELLIDYFVKNKITTSDFDKQIKKILFFNPAQINCANLINPSSLDARIHYLTGSAPIKNLFAFVFTFCGSPVILYGDEIGMTESAPLNFGGFNWDTKEQNRDLLNELIKLIKIRKTNPQISQKYFFTLYVNDINKVYAYDRGGLIVILNSSETQTFVKIPAWNGEFSDLMSGEKFIVESQVLRLSINPKSYRILKRET